MKDVTTTEETRYKFKKRVYKLARLEEFGFVLAAYMWGKDGQREAK